MEGFGGMGGTSLASLVLGTWHSQVCLDLEVRDWLGEANLYPT